MATVETLIQHSQKTALERVGSYDATFAAMERRLQA
jgi:hypothetical protein